MNLFGIIYKRIENCHRTISDKVMNHEGIHSCQAEDFIKNTKNKNYLRILGYTIFYILYLIEWLIKVICSIFTLFKIRAYRSISFEQEAYNNENNLLYQDNRDRYAWRYYIFKVIYKSNVSR